MTLAELVHGGRRARLTAIRELPASEPLRFALRRVLFTDLQAEVRAAAARRLGTFADVEDWLVDALADHSPLVRDAIVRALARTGTTLSAVHLRMLVAGDPLWWVRRSAIYALAAIAGEAEIPTFTRALADPFWRVRHGAVKVLAVLGANHPELRDEVVATADDTTTLAFLRASWGPVALEAPARAAAASELPAALLDPDPAVVTARLAAGEFSPRALVELLCDPHVPLRVLAARRIAASGDLDALIAALDWLEEPRIPHVAETVRRLLDGLGDRAMAVAEHALARTDRPGAARWAIDWVVATRSETLHDAALARAHADASLRRHVLRLASDRELFTWADDPFLLDAIATELHERRRKPAHDALLALDATDHPRTRALQLDVHGRRGNHDALVRGLADPHHGPRAVATRWLAADLTDDPDPAVREAALTPANAAARYAADDDPWVRRAAIDVLVRAGITVPALADPDPWIRARACELPIADDRAVAELLALLADRKDMVRAAALDAMLRLADGDARVRAVLPSLAGVARTMAYAWLSRALDEAAVCAARDALATESDDQVRAVLAGVAGLDVEAPGFSPAAGLDVEAPGFTPGAGINVAPRIEAATRARTRAEMPGDGTAGAAMPGPAAVARRGFGRAGFDVAPLAISGAYDLSPHALAQAAEAGVDLYFWEPGYDVLGKFLRARSRRDRLRVVTGTYHADAASIRADVDRALAHLRRDTLDAFLLFWTRSPARVDADAFAALDGLRRAGKVRAIGFSTHHRDLARAAIEHTPWDVVMIRHSAAHPGIEAALLPAARERGTAILTFSALCYGRMIAGANAPTASECYRYSLAQPGVTACISAPRRQRELVENLGVLADPTLPAERIAALREHGRGVHAESARFNALVRQPTRDAAAAARELLAAELPPDDARLPRRLPRPSNAKRSRTRLGSLRPR